jgi:hypothetical protein
MFGIPNQCVIYIQWTDPTVQVPAWKLDRPHYLPTLWKILSFRGVQKFITVFTHVATGIYSGTSNPLPTLQEHPHWFWVPHGRLFIVNWSFLPRGLFCQGVKLTKSPTFSADVKNAPPYALMAYPGTTLTLTFSSLIYTFYSCEHER